MRTTNRPAKTKHQVAATTGLQQEFQQRKQERAIKDAVVVRYVDAGFVRLHHRPQQGALASVKWKSNVRVL
jgi:hypothetical protein